MSRIIGAKNGKNIMKNIAVKPRSIPEIKSKSIIGATSDEGACNCFLVLPFMILHKTLAYNHFTFGIICRIPKSNMKFLFVKIVHYKRISY